MIRRTGTRRLDVAFVAALATLAAFTVLTASSRSAPPSGTADLSVTKVDAKDPVKAGAPIDYTITVTNNGPDTAAGTVVTDMLPKGVTYVSATADKGTCSAKGQKVTCNLGDLTMNGANDVVAVQLRVNAPLTAGAITNKVTVASNTPDPNKKNDSATQVTTVTGGGMGGGNGTPSCLGKKATIVGTPAGEMLTGTSGRDVIFGAGGVDEINGLGGKDVICGAGGSDRIKGGRDDDKLAGAGGRDRISGQGGNDVVRGGIRADRLRGGRGDDLLVGGRGRDRCRGGAGSDITRGC